MNYTAFFSEDVDSELEGVLGSGDVSMDSSWGLHWKQVLIIQLMKMGCQCTGVVSGY
ncbi:MAG: hypothetical protein R3E73_11710 [Porticoccaceae bacterium]